eukprot:3877607-Pleurochrysis_carterae.AAC.2
MASERAGGAGKSLRITCHSNSPPRRMKGSSVRRPSASGGSRSDRTSAKWQSVPAVDQSWLTDKRESRIDGTQRTPVRVYLSNLLLESRTVS